jgi:hypothetical protein
MTEITENSSVTPELSSSSGNKRKNSEIDKTPVKKIKQGECIL